MASIPVSLTSSQPHRYITSIAVKLAASSMLK